MDKVSLPIKTNPNLTKHALEAEQTQAVHSQHPTTRPNGKSTRVNDRLVVGLDFGSSFSGVAAAYSATPDDIDIIKTWPGGNGLTSDKVPSELSYENVGPKSIRTDSGFASHGTPLDEDARLTTPGQLKDVRWGFQLKPEEPRLRCMKLFLDRNQRLPSYVSAVDTADHLRKHDRNVMDAISDYLAQVYKHAMETLNRRYGQTFITQTPIEFVLTVPAVWSDQAKNATLLAAERAGLGDRSTLRLISEPEAAAVYTLQALQPSYMRVGDNFVVCDAGGGTVDLIAYRITRLSPFQIEESAVGTGALCGSAFLNYRFEDHVRSRIGADRFDWMREKKPKTWQMGLKHFEEFVKRNFTEDDTSEVNIPFPGLPDDDDAGVDSGFLIMSSAQIKHIFDPIVSQVISLVDGQVSTLRAAKAHVAGIVLVGGFGQSNYLYTKLKSHFNSSPSAPPPPYSEEPKRMSTPSGAQLIEVIQPVYAWTAVVRGAVLRGLEGSIVANRLSRAHYGTSYATVYNPEKHPATDRYWSPLWERWMVSDRMQWHISKGQQISESAPISFHYTRNFRAGQTLIVEDELIACEENKAPDAFEEETMFSVCTLTTDLSVVPRTCFTRLTTSKGVEFDNLDFTLDMFVDSAGLVFELKVDGRRYGVVQADFH